jgi:serine/threonine protein kinase/WD40 repeat protein
MNESVSQQNQVDALAEEFLERHRKGERPTIAEYTAKYPKLAEEIRACFPALLLVEDLKPEAADLTGLTAMGARLGPAIAPSCLGDYRLLREVGRGGMGVVYEAEQESLGRHVALKVLPAQALLDPRHVQRFQREARSAARLHHTNIVPVFGVGEQDGLHYYVMQFIHGLGLDQVLDELRRLRRCRNGTTPADSQAAQVAEALLTGRFSVSPVKAPSSPLPFTPEGERSRGEGLDTPPPAPLAVAPSASDSSTAVHLPGQAPHSTLSNTGRGYWQSVARVGVQVAEALAHAHGQGVLHRDIKPSNLLLDMHGTVWVTDFGLAKADDSDCLTQTGDIVGTLRYMAPERFGGKSDPRSDLYGLGVTLYELLTLRPAFVESDHNQLLHQVLHNEPPRPRKLNAEVPRDLETIVLKAIAREPKNRYASAAELAEDLRRFLADRPVKARRVSALERLWRWVRRNPALAAALASVAALLLIVAVGSTLAALRLKQAERMARLREAEALVGQAHGIRLSHRPGQRFEALEALGKAAAIGHELRQPPEWFDRPRNEAIAALALADVHITRQFGRFPPGSVGVELSGDFELYVRTTDNGACTVRRVADDTLVARLPALGERAHAGFGPGRVLAVLGMPSHGFQLWDVSGAEPSRRFEEKAVFTWAFHPNGRLVALAHQGGAISVYEVATGKPLHRLAPREAVPAVLQFHPREEVIAVFSYFSRVVYVRHLRTGAVVASATSAWPNGNGYGAWSPGGHTLLVPQGDGDSKIQEYAFDPAAPALRPTRLIDGGPYQGCPTITFHPAGDRFVSRGWSDTVHLFDAVSGQLLLATHQLPASSAYYSYLRFDPTGGWLAGARVGDRNDRIGVWSVAPGREYRYLAHANRAKSYGGPAIHPGGRLAAIGRYDGTDGVAFFDLETGRELAQVSLPSVTTVARFDGAGDLLTNGDNGCFRWPVRSDPANPGRLVVGPPERLPFHGGRHLVAASRDGRVIAQPMSNSYGMQAYAGGWILHPNSPRPRQVDAGLSAGWTSVSPDGRWVAFGDNRVNVYDAATGQRVWQSPAQQHPYFRFSRDGRWLLTAADGGRLYATGTWKPGAQLGSGRPWDATREVAVLGLPNGIYRLVELATGRELARLEDQEQNTDDAAFTPDCTRLVIQARHGLRVWDLRLLRAELARLGLDWDAPAYPPPREAETPPLALKVDAGKAARTVPPEEKARQAIAQYRRAIASNPRDPRAHNNLAWIYVTAPEALRDAKEAVRLAEEAVRLDPRNPVYQNTLGAACYRAGRYRQAVDRLEPNLLRQEDPFLAHDLYLLAMACHKLGESEKARLYYQWALRWTRSHKQQVAPHAEELDSFRAEAEAVLDSAKWKDH